AIRGPRDFQRAASLIGYAFNWFYVDSKHIAYLNSGMNPVRASTVDPDLPVMGLRRFEWRGWRPDIRWEKLFPIGQRAQVIDQSYLTSWNNKGARGGAHRIDRNRDGQYDEAEAVRIMDAWWPLWLHAEFQPTLGSGLFSEIEGMNELVNAPNNSSQHLGSAWQAGWYGYAQKDLRTVLGRRVRGRYSRVYCGHGSLKRCRSLLASSLKQALANHSPA